MSLAQASVVVAQTPGVVFDFVSNPRNDSAWRPSLMYIADFDGIVGVGSHWKEVSKFGRREMTVAVTVTAFERPHLFRGTGDAGAIKTDVSFEFKPVGEGTQINESIRFTGRGLMALLAPLIARRGRAGMRKDLERLKRTLDGEET